MPKGKSKTLCPKPVKPHPLDEPLMDDFTFVVHGRPVPKGRPRMTRRGRVYTPKESIEAEEHIAETINDILAVEDVSAFDGPVSVTMIFGKESTTVTIKDLGEISSPLRGDIDNYIKLLLDGIQRSPLIHNDRQVHHVDAVKV